MCAEKVPTDRQIDGQTAFHLYIVDVYIYIYIYAKQKQPGAVKKGAAKQSRIAWHLRWLVRTRADISLRQVDW